MNLEGSGTAGDKRAQDPMPWKCALHRRRGKDARAAANHRIWSVLPRRVDLILKTKRNYWKALNRSVTLRGDILIIPWRGINLQAGTQEVGRGIEGNSSGCCLELRIGDNIPRGT